MKQDSPSHQSLDYYCACHGIRLKRKQILPAKQAIHRMTAASPHRVMRVPDGEREQTLFPTPVLDAWRESRAAYRPTFADVAAVAIKAAEHVAGIPVHRGDPPFDPGSFPYRRPRR